MRRDLPALANQKFDLLVIGSGIYGACVAWDAALRGLSVSLIDQGDFGGATSANSLKIIHGGLRYLQDGKPWLMRQMSVERGIWMRIAPHLVHPLACLAPTYARLTRSKSAYTAGLMINDWISFDRNRLADPQKHLPSGQILSREACLARLPGIRPEGITGGALWYDAQIFSSERLLLSIVLAAAQAGAVVANYVQATGFILREQMVCGVKAVDRLSGQALEIQARGVVNCSGAWMDELLLRAGAAPKPRFQRSIAVNLVTRQVLPEPAVGFLSQPVERVNGATTRPRMLFMTPWRGCSITGTLHAPYHGRPEELQVTEETILDFLAEINQAFPGAALHREDVYYAHAGFLPMLGLNPASGAVRLLRESQIHDHQAEDQIDGLISVVGVKYTTARRTAEQAVDLVLRKLGREEIPGRTRTTPVYGGEIADFREFQSQLTRQLPDLEGEALACLAHTYGTGCGEIIDLIAAEPGLGQRISSQAPVLRAAVIQAIRHEMALKLADVVWRRTELASTGRLDDRTLIACAEIMAGELGWDADTKNQEIAEIRAIAGMRAVRAAGSPAAEAQRLPLHESAE